MPRSSPTDHVGAPVEILDSRLTHHREAALQLCQILPAKHLVRRSGTPGHGAPHLSARGTSTLLNNALLSAHFRVADQLSTIASSTSQRCVGDARRGHDLPANRD